MKFQSGYPYHLHLQFENPVREFLKNNENDMIIKEIMDERLIPKHKRETKTFKEFLWQSRNIYELGGGSIIDGEMYINQRFLISQAIVEKLLANLPFIIDINIIASMLKGGMLHEYYTTGKYGEKLMDRMDKEFEENGGGMCVNFRNNLVAFSMEEVEDKELNIEEFASYVEALGSGDPNDLDVETLIKVNEYRGRDKKMYQFSEEGIDDLNKTKLQKDLIRGFRQIRIKRTVKQDISFLIAIVSVAFFEEELFLYYNPRLFQLGICDRNGLNFDGVETYIVMNFSNIVESVFCRSCLNNVAKKYNLKTKEDIESNPNILKVMFDELYKQVEGICPDHVEVSVKGKVNDNKRIAEIDKKLPNAQSVGFAKHGGKKKGVNFELKDDLKSHKKRLKDK